MFLLKKSIETTYEKAMYGREKRQYQLDTLLELFHLRNKKENKAYVVYGTGGGKTTVASVDIINFTREFKKQHGREPRVLWLAHRYELLDQAESDINEKHGNYENELDGELVDIELARELEEEREEEIAENLSSEMKAAAEHLEVYRQPEDMNSKKSGILITSIQGITRHLDQYLPDSFDYIVVDECHHAYAPSYYKVLNFFQPQFMLGLTATPQRFSDGRHIGTFFKNKAADIDILTLIKEKYLSNLVFFKVKTNVTVENQELVSGDFNLTKYWKKISDRQQRNKLVVDTFLDLINRRGLFEQYHDRPDIANKADKPAITFCINNQHAKEMAELYEKNGIKTRYLYADGFSKTKRKQLIEDWKAGKFQMLCCVDIMNEGFDFPEIETLLMARPTRSKTLWMQQIGRGARNALNKLSAYILDFVDNGVNTITADQIFIKSKNSTDQNKKHKHIDVLLEAVGVEEYDGQETLGGERYGWQTEAEGIASMHSMAQKRLPDFWTVYETGDYELAKEILLTKISGIDDFISIFNGSPIRENVPYFEKSYVVALQKAFPGLELEAKDFGISGLNWTNESNAIASIHKLAKQNFPEFWSAYEQGAYSQAKTILCAKISGRRDFSTVFTKSLQQIESFEGKYVLALQKSFPELELLAIDFGIDWTDESKGIISMHKLAEQNLPEFWIAYKQGDYAKAKTLLSEKISKIEEFKVIFTNSPFKKYVAPYFEGSYLVALQKSFPELQLKVADFRLSWTTEENGIASMHRLARQNLPDFWIAYEQGNYLKAKKLLGESISGLNDFSTIFTTSPITKIATAYFRQSYLVALQKSFPALSLEKSDLGASESIDTKQPNRIVRTHHWKVESEGIDSMHAIAGQKLPEFWATYKSKGYVKAKRMLLKRITGGKDFSSIFTNMPTLKKHVPYFEGTYLIALQKSFPGLGLTGKDFGTDMNWTNESDAIVSMHKLAKRNFLKFWTMYKQGNYSKAKELLINKISNAKDFFTIFTGSSMNKKQVPFFDGKYLVALQKSFPELGLIENDFNRLSAMNWTTEANGISNMQKLAEQNLPEFWAAYTTHEYPAAKELLLKRITGAKDFSSIFTNSSGRYDYFERKYLVALQKSFPELQLTEDDFKRK
jgi:superfamily II DNA or RNA helicase